MHVCSDVNIVYPPTFAKLKEEIPDHIHTWFWFDNPFVSIYLPRTGSPSHPLPVLPLLCYVPCRESVVHDKSHECFLAIPTICCVRLFCESIDRSQDGCVEEVLGDMSLVIDYEKTSCWCIRGWLLKRHVDSEEQGDDNYLRLYSLL